MYNVDSLDNLDFYFNGHWLSEFDGIVAGKSGLAPLSVLPDKDIKTEKILGKHGELFYGATYNPRTFSIPVMFDDITKIREIAGWLSVLEPTDFYFKDDKIKIKCMVDSLLDLESYAYQGTVELKFIAHDPFYTSIDDIKYSFIKFDRSYTYIDPLTTFNAVSVTQYDRYTPATFELVDSDEQTIVTTDNELVYIDGAVTRNGDVISVEIPSWDNIEIFNDGNKESYPLITIVGRGSVTMALNGDNVFTVTLDTNTDETIFIDTFYLTAYYNTTNKISQFDGEFPTLPNGYSLISIVGTCSKLEVQCNSQWV